jgi:hypothetical protein
MLNGENRAKGKIIDDLTAYVAAINDRQCMLRRAESYRRVASEIEVLIKGACKYKVTPSSLGQPTRDERTMRRRPKHLSAAR